MNGLKFVRREIIPLQRIHFQYIPPPIFNKQFWHGDGSLLVQNSPHVRFLKQYVEIGKNYKQLWNTDYVKLMLYWNSLGYHNRTDKFIKSKIDRFTSLYKNMKRHGFTESNRIEVLKQPFWKTRYVDCPDWVVGYEMWHGHHRAACAYFLGMKEIPCNLWKDIKKGTKKCLRLDKKLKRI